MKFVFVTGFLLATFSVTQAQSRITQDDVKQMLARIDSSPTNTFNKKLSEELFKMATKEDELRREVVEKDQSKNSDKEKLKKTYEDHSARLCQIIKTNGWPTTALVTEGGVLATFEILRNAGNFELQRDLLPVIVAAIRKDPVQKREFALLLDRL